MNEREKEIIRAVARLDRRRQKFREQNRLACYNTGTVHQKQLLFHKSLCRNRWVFGGNRSGKTECGAAEAVYMARGNHPYRQNRADVFGWVVSVSSAVQRDVAQQKILSYINPEWVRDVVMTSGNKDNPSGGVIDYIAVENVFGGVSKIGFKSCEMSRDKFAGASLDFVWFDEEPPKDIYDECRMRVVDRKGDIFGTMTPLMGLTFIYNKIYMNEDADPQVWHIVMEWADNPYLDPAEIESVSKTMSQSELLSRRYGKFSEAKGLVYPEFCENTHVIEPFAAPSAWFNNISIDPGLNNPLSAHWYAVDGDGTVYVIAEHYEAMRDVSYHAARIKEISGDLGWHTDAFGRYGALIDSAASQRTLAASKSVAELFSDHGINVNTKVDKDMFSGISRVKEYLGGGGRAPRLYIFSTCKNLIREIKGYFWGADDTPKKRDDHALDELRYFIASRPAPYTERVQKSAVALDKERLIRKRKRKRIKLQ
ncbi:MAG: terminase family protein [Clostridiales bacterium]|jgi:phage terminase large subunit-like protein|nr:terminase family protein [Clostridiales bacterium]